MSCIWRVQWGRPITVQWDRAAWRRGPGAAGEQARGRLWPHGGRRSLPRGGGGDSAVSRPAAFPPLDPALVKGPVLRGTGSQGTASAPWSPAFRSQEAPRGPVVPPQPLLLLQSEAPSQATRGRARAAGKADGAPSCPPPPWATVSTPSCACGGAGRCGQTTVPMWKIPFPNHLGPTSMAILPHRSDKPFTAGTAGAQTPSSDTKNSPLEGKTEFRKKKNKAFSPTLLRGDTVRAPAHSCLPGLLPGPAPPQNPTVPSCASFPASSLTRRFPPSPPERSWASEILCGAREHSTHRTVLMVCTVQSFS